MSEIPSPQPLARLQWERGLGGEGIITWLKPYQLTFYINNDTLYQYMIVLGAVAFFAHLLMIYSINMNQRKPSYALPNSVQRAGRPLFEQQCWCWGHDVRRNAGNLLLEYGAERSRMPTDQRGSSNYRFQLANGATLDLWGWGLWYGDGLASSLFLRRDKLQIGLLDRAAPLCNVWSLSALPPVRMPQHFSEWLRMTSLLCACCTWIATYEDWVLEQAGLSYRQTCVADWQKQALPAHEMAERWQQLHSLIVASQETLSLTRA